MVQKAKVFTLERIYSYSSKDKKILLDGPEWGDHHFANWNGFTFHWRVLGDKAKKPIVLIHGFGASSDHWRKNAVAFAEAGFSVFALDLIGFGRSEQPSRKKINSLENVFWARQVTYFLKKIVLNDQNKKAVLIGNSLGGLVAVTILAKNPELVEATVACPLPDPALAQKQQIELNRYLLKIKNCFIKVIFNLLPLELIVPIIAKTKLISIALQFAYKKNISCDKDLIKLIKRPALRATAPRALRSMCIGMSLRSTEMTAPSILSKLSLNIIKSPLLLVWGKEDRLVPLVIGKNLKSQFEWVQLKVPDNVGHCPHDEAPKYFNNEVLDWLNLNLPT